MQNKTVTNFTISCKYFFQIYHIRKINISMFILYFLLLVVCVYHTAYTSSISRPLPIGVEIIIEEKWSNLQNVLGRGTGFHRKMKEKLPYDFFYVLNNPHQI